MCERQDQEQQALEELDLELSKTHTDEDGEAPRILRAGRRTACSSACGKYSACGKLVRGR